MSSILVVEHEGRYIERIQDALSSEGWSPRFVAGRPEALRAAASEQPALVLVNSDLPGAPELLRAFARRNGGPGAVALVPEREGDVSAGDLGADDLLFKPFTDQDLRLMVRRGLSGQLSDGRAAAVSLDVPEDLEGPAAQAEAGDAAGAGEVKLSSQDIFGELLAEVEDEVGGAGDAEEPEAPEAPAAAAVDATTPPPSPPQRTADDDEEIERRLEKTLSGVLDPRSPRRRRKAPERKAPETSPPAAPSASLAPAGAPPPKRRKRRADTDVEELLNLTLSGLGDLPTKQRKKKARRADGEAAEGREEPFDDLDLSELDALAQTGRGASRRRPADAPSTATPAEPPPEPPAEEEPGDASWADVAQALEEDGGTGAEVQPPPDLAPPERSETTDAGTAGQSTAEGSGDTFGPYTLEERIAVGGMAEVWKARMSGVEGFQKTVAIKKILPQMTDSTDFVNMFIDEAKLAAQLNHPNITHIYDLGKIGRDYYIAMEFVDGPNLRSVLNQARRKGAPLPVGLALLIGARLASALDYAHRKRDFDGRRLELVHRDVSPQNVLLSYEGDIKLCDFGIVKAVTKVSHTEMGALKGKLQYMSPEQAWGRQVDSRSDIFSLGALLFEMLTGERLFAGDSEISVLDAVRECHVRSPRELNPVVPERAEEVILRALEEQPEDRYANAGDLQHGLEQILYQLRPAPSQADLAAWLREVEAAPELDEAEREAFSWADAVPRPVIGEPGGGAERAAESSAQQATAAPGGAVDDAATDGGAQDDEESATGTDTGTGASVLPDVDAPMGAVTQPLPRIDAAPEPAGSSAVGNEPGAAQDAGEGTAAGGTAVHGAALRPPAAAAAAAEGTGTGVVAPVDGGEVELEEGGRRGLWLVIILMLLAILAGLVWYFVFGPGADELSFDPAPLPPSSTDAPEEPAALDPADQVPAEEVPAEQDGGGGPSAEPEAGGAQQGAEQSPPAAAAPADQGETGAERPAVAQEAPAGVSMTDLQAIVDEQMARKEQEIRRQKEEELRRLEAELARVRQQSDEAGTEAASEEEGGGDGR